MLFNELKPEKIDFTQLQMLHPESGWVKAMADTWIGEEMEEKNTPIAYIDHDLVLTGDLDLDDKQWRKRYGLLFIAGHLTLQGVVKNFNENSGLHLGVQGNIVADAIIAGGSMIYIDGDAHVTHFVYGHYNDGALHIQGTTHAPLVIFDDHDLAVNCSPDTVQVECFCGQDEENVLAAAVKNAESEIDIAALLAYMQAGKNPLNTG